MPTMTSAQGLLPCFTTTGTNRLWHDGLKRWMSAREKMCASGLPVTEEQAKAANIPRHADWEADWGWHKRVGNGQQLQNVGLILIAILSNLKLKDTAPSNILELQPPSEPEGLTPLKDGSYLLSIAGIGFKLATKDLALQAHQALHVPLLRYIRLFKLSHNKPLQ